MKRASALTHFGHSVLKLFWAGVFILSVMPVLAQRGGGNTRSPSLAPAASSNRPHPGNQL